mmetsp:Transcript_8038/g.11871  ORF Transcript_8038/g.11871 Transcript_8038/m.11871 type:complete len:90 (-) Transcript_8038:609-878(-)
MSNLSTKLKSLKFMTKNSETPQEAKPTLEEKWTLKHIYKPKVQEETQVADDPVPSRISFGGFNPAFELKKRKRKKKQGKAPELRKRKTN